MSPQLLFKRLLLALPTLFGVGLVVFILMRVVPGDPIAMMIPPGASPQDIATLRAHYGLDHSIAVQFGIWVKEVLHGNFGTSITFRQDVLDLIGERLPATLELGIVAMVLACVLGGMVGVLSSAWHGGALAGLLDGGAALVQSIPDFLWGLVFILVFGVLLPWLPVSGRLDPALSQDAGTGFILLSNVARGRWDIVGSLLSHMVAPALALGLPVSAMLARVLKASMQEALGSDYVMLARLKGLSGTRVLLREALPNAITPTLSLSAVQFAFLLGGTVLIERLFSYPGIGSLAITAVIGRDLPLIQAVVLTFAVLFISINLAVDTLVVALNPRLRGSKA
jgi:ABC-type dipeptide/oligopeptide/nickel transport system permease component